jgi:hypothetical protein
MYFNGQPSYSHHTNLLADEGSGKASNWNADEL